MILTEIYSDLIKHDIKNNRGRRLKKLVRAAAKGSNPVTHGAPFISGHPEVHSADNPVEQGQFSESF